MSFKIGFTAETEKKEKHVSDNTPCNKEITNSAKKSVVDVFFPDRHLTCTYYNDRFDLKCGDTVFVDGKLEGLRGRVVRVNYTFRIKLSDYKRVVGVADTDVTGEFHMAGSHFISLDRTALPYEKALTWFKAPTAEDEEFVSSSDGEVYNLYALHNMKIDSAIAERGHEYYAQNRVLYIEIKDGVARAIVQGTAIYEVEFAYHSGDFSDLVCSCYCAGTCKHEFAALLQLKETLDTISEEYGDGFEPDYLAVVNKATFFEYVIDNKVFGSFTLG